MSTTHTIEAGQRTGSANIGESELHLTSGGVTFKDVQGSFSLRRDRNGLRPVFLLGNMLGHCPYDCRFCNVKAKRRVSPREALRRFKLLWSCYKRSIDGPYHPLIYNQGNVTNPQEFSVHLLDWILETFRRDLRVSYVSLNSREHFATETMLRRLANKALPYPIHFVFGLESFSSRTRRILGKDTSGELERFFRKLAPFNNIRGYRDSSKLYVFGLDVSLLFLPELYLLEGETRKGNEQKIQDGIEQDLKQLLEIVPETLPIQLNIHPYWRVDSLPYDDADFAVLAEALPRLQGCVDEFNASRTTKPAYLFIGVGGAKCSNGSWRSQFGQWRQFIELFNRTGRWGEEYNSARHVLRQAAVHMANRCGP